MTEADLDEVLALERVCFPDPWSEESFRHELDGVRDGVYPRVARLQGRLAAYLIAWFVLDEAHLANIATNPEFRRRGVAQALLDDLLLEARRREAKLIVLEVRVSNEAAIRLYRQYGFREVAIRRNYYARQKEDALVMIRTFSDPEEGVDGLAV